MCICVCYGVMCVVCLWGGAVCGAYVCMYWGDGNTQDGEHSKGVESYVRFCLNQLQ